MKLNKLEIKDILAAKARKYNSYQKGDTNNLTIVVEHVLGNISVSHIHVMMDGLWVIIIGKIMEVAVLIGAIREIVK